MRHSRLWLLGVTVVVVVGLAVAWTHALRFRVPEAERAEVEMRWGRVTARAAESATQPVGPGDLASVLDAVAAAEAIELPFSFEEREPGDPPVADDALPPAWIEAREALLAWSAEGGGGVLPDAQDELPAIALVSLAQVVLAAPERRRDGVVAALRLATLLCDQGQLQLFHVGLFAHREGVAHAGELGPELAFAPGVRAPAERDLVDALVREAVGAEALALGVLVGDSRIPGTPVGSKRQDYELHHLRATLADQLVPFLGPAPDWAELPELQDALAERERQRETLLPRLFLTNSRATLERIAEARAAYAALAGDG